MKLSDVCKSLDCPHLIFRKYDTIKVPHFCEDSYLCKHTNRSWGVYSVMETRMISADCIYDCPNIILIRQVKAVQKL